MSSNTLNRASQQEGSPCVFLALDARPSPAECFCATLFFPAGARRKSSGFLPRRSPAFFRLKVCPFLILSPTLSSFFWLSRVRLLHYWSRLKPLIATSHSRSSQEYGGFVSASPAQSPNFHSLPLSPKLFKLDELPYLQSFFSSSLRMFVFPFRQACLFLHFQFCVSFLHFL